MIDTKLRNFLRGWGILYFIFVGIIAFTQSSSDVQKELGEKAAFVMQLGHFITWALLVAPFFLPRFLPAVVNYVKRFNFGKKTLFVLLATLATLIEEGISILWNNNIASSFALTDNTVLTVTTNYFDLITKHSVVAFIPMLVAWAFLLSRWRYNATEAFVYFGMAGILAELIYNFNLLPVLAAGLWIFIYGFMVYTPALIVFGKEEKFTFSFHRAGFAIFLPFLATVPVAFLVALITK